jgi:hypothetical protein
VTEDRVTWRTTDDSWFAQLERSANARQIWMAFYHHGFTRVARTPPAFTSRAGKA